MLRRGRGRPRKHFCTLQKIHLEMQVEQSRTSNVLYRKHLALRRHRILELANANFCSTIPKQRRSLRDLKHFARQLVKEASPEFDPSCQQSGIVADFRASSQCGDGPVHCNSSGSEDVANLRSEHNDWVGVEVILCGRKASIGEVGSTTSNVCDELRSFIVDAEREQLCASFSKNLNQVEPEVRNEDLEFRESKHGGVPSWLNMTRKRRMNASGGISDCHITALIASLPETRSRTGEENGLHLCADAGAVISMEQSFASQESIVNSGQGSSLGFGQEKQANTCVLQRDAIQVCPTTPEKAQKRRRKYQDTVPDLGVRCMDGVPTGISDTCPSADVHSGKSAGGGLTLMADFLLSPYSVEFESSCNSTGMGELGLYVTHPGSSIPTPPFENNLTIDAVEEELLVSNIAVDSNRRKEDRARFEVKETLGRTPKTRKKYKPRVAKDKPTHNSYGSRLGKKPTDEHGKAEGVHRTRDSHRNRHQEETRIGPVESTSADYAHLARNAFDEDWPSPSHSLLCTSCALEQIRSESSSDSRRQEQFEVLSVALADRVLALLGLPSAGESEQDSQASEFVRCYTKAALRQYTDEGSFSLFGEDWSASLDSLSGEMTAPDAGFDLEHPSAGFEDPLVLTLNDEFGPGHFTEEPDLLHLEIEEPGLGAACKPSDPENRTMSSFYASTSAGVTKNMLSRLNEMIEQNIQQFADKDVENECVIFDHNTRGFKEDLEDMALCLFSSQVQNSDHPDSTAAEASRDLEISKVCPRNKICPAKTPFHLMTYAQLVAYIKIILTNSSETSPLQLLRHVQDYLVGNERTEFEKLWPMILHPVDSAQLAKLADMAEIDLPQTTQEEGGTYHLEEEQVTGRNSLPCQQGESMVQAHFSSCKDIIQYRQDCRSGNSCLEVIPYNHQSEDSHLTAVVPYVSEVGNSVVVYDGPILPLRKRKPRPKVYLDPDTIRVWKLLMGKTEATESDPDIDNELKWKQERLLMQEQAESFIRRMHSIQGDRSFSRWKGSVVDSVVGVFLTQNVSDVLSSSAFMYLRARFPIRKPPREDLGDMLQDDNPTPLQTLEEPQILCSYEVLSNDTSETRELDISESHASLTSKCQQGDYILTEEVMMSSRLELLLLQHEMIDDLQQTEEKALAVDVVQLTGIERARIEAEQVYARKSLKWEALAEKYNAKLRRDLAPQRLEITEDGVDWEAVRCADLEDIADAIKDRGMNWKLAGRIKGFLERLRQEQGDIDLEWLRSIPSDDAKEFLSSVHGLGLKSVECIRLLALHHNAFPVDTNVGRICVRLGWVPLEPLPEELQLHVLELYPVQATIQKYLWPRLCTLDQQTLYELHYQLITFGKVFCTKSKPNCNACPMRSDCKHFASALSSAKLALPASDIASQSGSILALQSGNCSATELEESPPKTVHSSMCMSQYCQPIIEEPMTPESEADFSDGDIEDYPFSVEEIEPTMEFYRQESHLNLSTTLSEAKIVQDVGIEISETSLALEESQPKVVSTLPEMVDLDCEGKNMSTRATVLFGDAPSREVVMLPPEAASIPVPKLKNIERLRTVHYVYELPDNHPLLDEMDIREVDDPCFYLLAIWSPGEVPESIPNINDDNEEASFASCNFPVDEDSIKGTLLVPCRTAMRGSFPLNGTYFQVNEVFADHQSSLQPIQLPRVMLWNLRRRYVYFGTSVTSILRGMTVEEIQACFWRGYVCVRGFDRTTRAPKPLVSRLHFQTTKAISRNVPFKTTKP